MKGNCCLKIFSESHCPVVLWTLCLEKASVSVSVFGPLQYIILDVQVKYISHRNVVGEKHFKIFPSRKVFSTSLWQQNLTSTFWKVCWSWIPLVCACAGWSGTATVPEPAGHYTGSKRTLGHLSLQLCTLP